MPKDSQNICDELKSTVVCRVALAGIAGTQHKDQPGQNSGVSVHIPDLTLV